jgi:hypothetical protein
MYNGIQFVFHRYSNSKYLKLSRLCNLDYDYVRFYLIDDGGSMHLWNVGEFQRDYTALHPRRL